MLMKEFEKHIHGDKSFGFYNASFYAPSLQKKIVLFKYGYIFFF
jgi:hypothetical protein